MAVILNTEKNRLEFEDMGVTIRTLLAHANNGYILTGRRVWHLYYKGVKIGSVQVKDKEVR